MYVFAGLPGPDVLYFGRGGGISGKSYGKITHVSPAFELHASLKHNVLNYVFNFHLTLLSIWIYLSLFYCPQRRTFSYSFFSAYKLCPLAKLQKNLIRICFQKWLPLNLHINLNNKKHIQLLFNYVRKVFRTELHSRIKLQNCYIYKWIFLGIL